jgi:hypothetical protein
MSVERVIGAALVGVVVWAFLDSKKSAAPELQGLFERFHEAIKLEENDERRKLREKRDILLAILKKKLAVQSLTFESFHQGSYAMRTGVVPKDGNYDIDIGLIFECSQERFPDPVALKCLVRDALSGNNRSVRIRRACVTVTYITRGRPDYHVDLALYLKQNNGRLLLAKGHEFAGAQQRVWVASAPDSLTKYVLSKFTGEDQAQFRRCIRYLKRWRDENFETGAPLSIALTLAAAHWFEPRRTKDRLYVDLDALNCLVKTMGQNFGNRWAPNRLAVPLPGFMKADLMAGLTDAQMLIFRERLTALELTLEQCCNGAETEVAARLLAAQFGPEFPSL